MPTPHPPLAAPAQPRRRLVPRMPQLPRATGPRRHAHGVSISIGRWEEQPPETLPPSLLVALAGVGEADAGLGHGAALLGLSGALLHLARRCRPAGSKVGRFPSIRLSQVLKAINPGHRRWRSGPLVEDADVSDRQMQQCHADALIEVLMIVEHLDWAARNAARVLGGDGSPGPWCWPTMPPWSSSSRSGWSGSSALELAISFGLPIGNTPVIRRSGGVRRRPRRTPSLRSCTRMSSVMRLRAGCSRAHSRCAARHSLGVCWRPIVAVVG